MSAFLFTTMTLFGQALSLVRLVVTAAGPTVLQQTAETQVMAPALLQEVSTNLLHKQK